MNELDIEKERELLRKMMEHSKAEQERKLEAARLKAEIEDAAWWDAKLQAQKVYDENLHKEILMEEDSYGKFKAEQEKVRDAFRESTARKQQAQKQARENTPGWGGFS